MNDDHPNKNKPEDDTRIIRAKLRVEQAEVRTEQAEARILQAKTRTELAETRTEQAESRTELAKTRTEQAEIRTEQAETRSEQAIRSSELGYRRLFEAAREGILIMEADTGRISDVNPFLIELLGYSRGELIGARIWELGSFRNIISSKAEFEQSRQQGYVLCENLTLETQAGRKISAEFSSNVYQAGDKNVVQCNIRDLTARKATEVALQETEQQLRIVFSESPLGIALVGVDGCPVLTNAALQKMLGYTDKELSRMPFTNFTHPEDCAKDLDLYQQLIQGIRKNYQIEKRYLRKDGQVVLARLSVSVARGTGSHANFAIGMVEDITERRNLEMQFIEAQKMDVIGQLASGVAHDFNNILAIIMGYSDLLTGAMPSASPFQKYTEEIQHASERAARLTQQLLVFSRKQTVKPVVLDLNAVVQDLDKMLQRLIDENIEMTMVLEKQIGHIKADSGYIGQVLMNLVINARDAMPEGGKLTIATNNVTLDGDHGCEHKDAIPGDYVMLSVNDTGTGMTDKVKKHLFEAFFTTKPLGKGTGLGLATCRTIVEQCVGHINFSSEEGKGTTFRVYFPRVDLPLNVAALPIQTGPLPRGTETLLLVEDEPGVRNMARQVLENQGYEVLSAPNGQDALRLVREHTGAPIRLVVSDVIMPLMGGKAMVEWLKTTYPDLKILFTSGYTDDAIIEKNVLEKGIEFLPKPYTPAMLTHKVREMLDKGKA